MRVTIEIEPEEAARFVKAFMPDPIGFAEQLGANSFAQHLQNKAENAYNPMPWPSFWNEAAGKWLDAIRDKHGTEK